MLPREVSKELRKVQIRNENAFTLTGVICISDMAKDAADAIDSLQSFVDFINTLPNCNDCAIYNCVQKPAPGQAVRYNCAFFLKKGE